jgi:hypothetical protein
MSRRASFPALCLFATLLRLMIASAPAEASLRCQVRGHAVRGVAHSRVAFVSLQAVVYRTRGASADGLWTCSPRTHRFVLVGRDDSYQSAGSEYGPSTSLRDIHVAGEWVLVTHETGAEQALACNKYGGYPCPGPVDTLVAVNVSRGLRGEPAEIMIDHTDATGKSSGIELTETLLSAAGGVAWLQTGAASAASSAPTPLTPSLFGCAATITKRAVRCAAHLIAQGQIDPASLQFSMKTLSWSEAGQLRSAAV